MTIKQNPRVLVVGGGGREAAIIWKLARSPRQPRLFCSPGNYGISQLAEIVPLRATDIDGLVRFAVSAAMDLVVVAPDDPLALGLVDRLTEAGIRAFGPTAAAARLESSKIFSKRLMLANGIPTASAAVFESEAAALAWIDRADGWPKVVKADGLALGKGVIICPDRRAAAEAVHAMMGDGAFGAAGRHILIEDCLYGPELTVLAFTDGKTLKTMPCSRDHKRALDGDRGLNTGGMGAVVPGADLSPADWAALERDIFKPTLRAMSEAGTPFKGVIYFGLMLTADGPKVIEYNARFGDPECQAILPLLKSDLLDILDAVIDERLAACDIRWSPDAACTVVAASGGYPGHYETGFPITGLPQTDGLPQAAGRQAGADGGTGGGETKPADAGAPIVFHAGTRWSETCQAPVTAGGRVLCVTAVAPTLPEAIDAAYRGLSGIRFDHMHVRSDIGRTLPAGRADGYAD